MAIATGFSEDIAIGFWLGAGAQTDIDADPDRVAQVVTNLLANAVKFSPHGGNVRVGAHREGDAVVVWVADTAIVSKQLDNKKLYYVADAVTGQPIPLAELRYWNVERQEAYAGPEVVLQRFHPDRVQS